MINHNTPVREQESRPPLDGGPRPPAPTIPSQLSISSINCQGLNNPDKRSELIHTLKNNKSNVFLLQETKLSAPLYNSLQFAWKNPLAYSSSGDSTKGVATLTKNIQLNLIFADTEGRLIISSLVWNEKTVLLVNVYAPNDITQQNRYFSQVTNLLHQHTITDQVIILMGDFNCILDNELDRLSSSTYDRSPPTTLLSLINSYDLVDVFRELHPLDKTMSWTNGHSASRLDRCYISKQHLNLLKTCSFEHFIDFDHSGFTVSFIHYDKALKETKFRFLYTRQTPSRFSFARISTH